MSVGYYARAAVVLVGLGGALLITGCGSGVIETMGSQVEGFSISGRVHGGQQPITGASISLYIAGTTGYGVNAQPLPSSISVTSDNSGLFHVSGSYQCPSPTAQVYLISRGGNTGSGINNRAVLMSALGNCSTFEAPGAFINVSEVSTVASVYALAQFMKAGSTNVGTSPTNVVGLNNAFATVTNLLDVTSGLARTLTPAKNGKVPQSTINTLADIMAACVNSMQPEGPCAGLFTAATPPGGTAPVDTLAAMVNIAKNPGLNVTKIYNLPTAQGAYQPSLTSAPNDWTLSIEYNGGGLHQGQLPAVDAEGNIWVPNHLDPGTISEFSPTGEPLSGSGFSGGGLSYPEAVAVDLNGNVWAANEGNSTVSEHTSGGTPLSGTGFTMAGLQFPYAIVVDGSGNVFTADGNNTVAMFNPSGLAEKLIAGGGLDVPFAIALDGSENLWIANGDSDPQANTLSKFSNDGVPASATGFSGGGLSVPYFVAVDANGSVWAANFYSSSVSELSSTGMPLSGAGYATPNEVSVLAIDGDNTVWTANTDGSVSHLANSGVALSPAGGYVSSDATAEVGLVIDGSGNVWTTDYYVDSLFEYIGAGAPVTVPMALAVKNNAFGVRP